MNTQHSTGASPSPASVAVPVIFEEWRAKVGATRLDEPGRCEGCMKEGPLWMLPAPNAMAYCDRCLRHFHAHDLGEAKMVRGILAAAVSAALCAGASEALVRVAVDDAFREAVHVELAA